MLYFLHGTDGDKARTKARDLYESLLKKKPDASLYKIDAENWNSAELQEKIEGQGLFEQKFIIFLDRVFQNTEAKELVIEKRKEIAESQNIFIMLESKVDKATLSKIEKVAEKVQPFDFTEKKKKEDFNIFALTYAFDKRDKKKLWILFTQAVAEGKSGEEIHGVLFWQLKNMLKSRNVNYTPQELKKLSSHFVEIYHEAHRGKYELMGKIEQTILGL